MDILSRSNQLHEELELKQLVLNNSQSQVYQARHKNSNNKEFDFILKVYEQENFQIFEEEVKILQKLKGQKLFGFPEMISFKSSSTKGEILFKLLGKNLRQLLQQYQSFSKISVIKIALQILSRLENLHSSDIVHNDIKLENFVIGADDPDQIYLIDFGISTSYKDQNGRHIPKRFLGRFSGNIFFSSINGCIGNNKSRKDDLESFIYFIGYLFNNSLPWMTFPSSKEFLDLLEVRQNKTLILQFIHSFPKELNLMLNYIYQIRFNETPNYQFIRSQLQDYLNQECQKQNIALGDHQFEWVQNEILFNQKDGEISYLESDEGSYSPVNKYQFKSKLIPQKLKNSFNRENSLQDIILIDEIEKISNSYSERNEISSEKNAKKQGFHLSSRSISRSDKFKLLRFRLMNIEEEIKEIQESEEYSKINKLDNNDKESILSFHNQNINNMFNQIKIQQDSYQKEQQVSIYEKIKDIKNNNLQIQSQKEKLENIIQNEMNDQCNSSLYKMFSITSNMLEDIDIDEFDELSTNMVSYMNFNSNDCQAISQKNQVIQ